MAKAKEKVNARKSGYDTGMASEFLVLSNLYRLGVNAFISLGNKKILTSSSRQKMVHLFQLM
jgi:hypothetical protein